jgi:hypothetical protein
MPNRTTSLAALLALVVGNAAASPATASLAKTDGSDMVFELGATSATTTEKMRITTAGVVSASAFTGDGSQLTAVVTPSTPVMFWVDKNGGTQSVPAYGSAILTWSREQTDSHNFFSSNRFTPKVPGIYLVTLMSTCSSAGAMDWCAIAIMKNSSTYSYTGFGEMTFMMHSLSAIVPMNGTTDYLEAATSNESATDVTMADDGGQTYFSGVLIR